MGTGLPRSERARASSATGVEHLRYNRLTDKQKITG